MRALRCGLIALPRTATMASGLPWNLSDEKTCDRALLIADEKEDREGKYGRRRDDEEDSNDNDSDSDNDNGKDKDGSKS